MLLSNHPTIEEVKQHIASCPQRNSAGFSTQAEDPQPQYCHTYGIASRIKYTDRERIVIEELAYRVASAKRSHAEDMTSLTLRSAIKHWADVNCMGCEILVGDQWVGA